MIRYSAHRTDSGVLISKLNVDDYDELETWIDAAVHHGIEFLRDKARRNLIPKNWVMLLDPQRLEIMSGCRCVLGQLRVFSRGGLDDALEDRAMQLRVRPVVTNPYLDMWSTLSGFVPFDEPDQEDPADLGFVVPDEVFIEDEQLDDTDVYRHLTKRWRYVIAAMQAREALRLSMMKPKVDISKT